MRNMAVLHSPAFSYPLPVLVRVLSNLLIFKGKILYYNKYTEKKRKFFLLLKIIKVSFSLILVINSFHPIRNTCQYLIRNGSQNFSQDRYR